MEGLSENIVAQLTSDWKCQNFCGMGQYGRLTVYGTSADISAHCVVPK